jgi:hypothetical protein
VSVHYFWTLILFAIVMAGAYRAIGRTMSGREGFAMALGFVAAWPLMDGGFAVEREMARRERGRIDAGVVLSRYSSSGADGTRTIGRRYRRRHGTLPYINTADGFRIHDILARWLLTGSRDAWVVDFRYPCGGTSCSGRDFVGYELWSRLRPGQTVNVRSVEGRIGSGRLSANDVLPAAAVEFGMGTALALVALVVYNGLPTRRKYRTAPAVVTAVEPVPTGDTAHWRVRFAYFDDEGRPRESSDQVFMPGLRPGDECVARFPKGQPDLGTLDTGPARTADAP